MNQNSKPDTNSSTWREGYSSGQKSMFSTNDKTHQSRLQKMDIFKLDKSASILDIGCGDGNLMTYLLNEGYDNIHGVEPDIELIKSSTQQDRIKHGDSTSLPFDDESFDAYS